MSAARDIIKQLTDMSIDEVSFVDRPANPEARIEISKNEVLGYDDEDEDEDEVGKASPDSKAVHSERPLGEDEEEDKEEGRLKKFFSKLFGTNDVEEIEKNFQQGYGQKPPGLMPPGPMTPQAAPLNGPPQVPFQAAQMQAPAGPSPAPPQMPQQQPQGFPGQQPGQVPGQMPGQVPGQMPGMEQQQGQLAPLPQEVVDYINELEKQVQNLSQTDGGGASNSGSNENPFGKSEEFEDMPEDVALLEELAKSLESEEQREAIYKALDLVAEAEERAAAAEEIAKAEREHRLDREYVEIAKTYEHIPVSAEEFGPVLKRLHERMETEDVEVLEKTFRLLDEEMSGLFQEVGKRGGYESDVVGRVNAEVAEIRKSQPDMSMEQAQEHVLSQNPKLYDEYLRETAGRA